MESHSASMQMSRRRKHSATSPRLLESVHCREDASGDTISETRSAAISCGGGCGNCHREELARGVLCKLAWKGPGGTAGSAEGRAENLESRWLDSERCRTTQAEAVGLGVKKSRGTRWSQVSLSRHRPATTAVCSGGNGRASMARRGRATEGEEEIATDAEAVWPSHTSSGKAQRT